MKRFSLFALLVAAMVIVVGCGKPPETQIQQAKAAYQAAEAAGAPQYAPEAWGRAKQAMDRLNAELDAQGKKSGLLRNYGRARTLADETLRLAKQAATDAGKKKDQLASDAAALIGEAKQLLQSAETRLAALPRVRGVDAAALRATLASARQQIDLAQADLDAGRFDDAQAKGAQARDAITRVLREIERVTGQSPSKKR